MAFEDLTLALFAACNAVRVVGYFPQIWKAATDIHGASAVSCTTWALFLVAHLSTVAYAAVNRADWGLAACFAGNALCCIVILAVTIAKRRQHARRVGTVAKPQCMWPIVGCSAQSKSLYRPQGSARAT